MTQTILALRVARRAIGTAVLEGESLRAFDGRHLNSNRERAERAITAYLERLIETHHPRGAVIFAPDERHDSPTNVLRLVQTVLVKAGISIRLVRCREMLKAFGHPSLRTRRELQEVTLALLPDLAHGGGALKPFIIETGAVALYAQTMLGLLAGAA